jgi:hypothetical protein
MGHRVQLIDIRSVNADSMNCVGVDVVVVVDMDVNHLLALPLHKQKLRKVMGTIYGVDLLDLIRYQISKGKRYLLPWHG